MKKIIASFLLVTAAAFSPLLAQAGVSLSVNIAPPPLPVYAQPPMPGDGYMWTPGYWGWDPNNNDYYWVPGTWVLAPYSGALWTPGYWGWSGGLYIWHGGYWGTHIGYYGGVNYGFGYGGNGYQGGHWDHGSFNYNRSVNNVGNVRGAHVYNERVTNVSNNRASFNGGKGGVNMQQSKSDEMISNMPHNGPTAPQANHESAARDSQPQRASFNHGMPPVAATPEPGKFNAPNISAARPAAAAPRGNSQPRQGAPGGGSHGGGSHEEHR